MNEILFADATELLRKLRDGEVTSLELVEATIAHIEAVNPPINAVVAKDYDRALDSARAADETRRRDAPVGPLHGLPITVKDSLETAGLVTTSGSPELQSHVPAENAVAVQRVVEAGALVLGKTNSPLFAGDWQTFNEVYGRTNNPWNTERTPGGSSGGPAAAVCAGFAALEIGSDMAGSIRTPASHCGVYGHKPTYGIIPTRGHIPGPPGTRSEADLAVVGPIARSARDLALALHVMGGPDCLDRNGWSLSLPKPRSDMLEGFRVGYWFDDPLCPIDSLVRAELEATVEALRPHTKLVEVDLPFALDRVVPLYSQLLLAVMGGAMPRAMRALAASMVLGYGLAELVGVSTDLLKQNVVRGMQLSHSEWNRVHEARARLRWQCRSVFEDIDVLLTPIVPVPAPTHQTKGNQLSREIVVNGAKRPYLDHIPWIALASCAYLPATSAPIGRTPAGLPVNIQIIGDHLDDLTTIRFAELLAGVRGGYERPPLGC